MLGVNVLIGVMLGVNVEIGDVRNVCFDRCNLMLRMNMEMLMLGSFDRCNVRSECGNERMLGANVLIGAMLGVNVGMGEC